jgi:hypothetical protein
MRELRISPLELMKHVKYTERTISPSSPKGGYELTLYFCPSCALASARCDLIIADYLEFHMTSPTRFPPTINHLKPTVWGGSGKPITICVNGQYLVGEIEWFACFHIGCAEKLSVTYSDGIYAAGEPLTEEFTIEEILELNPPPSVQVEPPFFYY